MSKNVYATTTHHSRHSPSLYAKQTPYISSLTKLDRLTNRYQPKKVLENEKYAELCKEGKCELFEISPSHYRYYYINRETSNDILNDLIDYAKETKRYTIDTEDQLQRQPLPSRGALIQIEFIHEDSPSILILIETVYLPPEESLKFKKIQELCQIIFSKNNNKIFSWGDAGKEFEKFYEFHLFNRSNINRMESENIQDKFKEWYSHTHPTCPYNYIKVNEKYSLQLAIFLSFNKWLDKRMTLANWGCGIDLLLDTISIPREFNYAKNQIIEDEKQYRQLMTVYALNDCLAVTQLVQMIYSVPSLTTSTVIYDNISENEDEMIYDLNIETTVSSKNENKNDYELILHEQHDLLVQDDKNKSGVHEQNELYEVISDDELDNMSLPDIMKIHRPFIEPYSKRNESHIDDSCKQSDPKRVRVRDEPDNDIEDISDDEPKKKKLKQYPDFNLLTKNQRKNRKKRANRYRFEIIRQIYHKFTIRNIKKTLLFMNISYVNVNVVGTTLFIGVKNEQIRRTVDAMLNDEIFTKEHYDRIRKKLHLDPK